MNWLVMHTIGKTKEEVTMTLSVRFLSECFSEGPEDPCRIAHLLEHSPLPAQGQAQEGKEMWRDPSFHRQDLSGGVVDGQQNIFM